MAIEIVSCPINSMVIFHSFLYVYQRVTLKHQRRTHPSKDTPKKPFSKANGGWHVTCHMQTYAIIKIGVSETGFFPPQTGNFNREIGDTHSCLIIFGDLGGAQFLNKIHLEHIQQLQRLARLGGLHAHLCHHFPASSYALIGFTPFSGTICWKSVGLHQKSAISSSQQSNYVSFFWGGRFVKHRNMPRSGG